MKSSRADNNSNGSCCRASPIVMKPLNEEAGDGCSSNADNSPNPLPRRQLFLIWLIHASQGFQTTMLFPMLVFMVEKYGVTGASGRAIGWRAGLLASLFPLAQFCTSMIWGIISDKTGRKPWLGFGCTVSAISALLLGVCGTYNSACYIRFFGGLLNGTLTVTKSALAEICDGTNQAQGFGILNLAWGIGSVTGPVISGLLAQPCFQYKLKHCPSALEAHPFLLPCIGAAVFSAAGIVASFSFQETNPKFLRYELVLGCISLLSLLGVYVFAPRTRLHSKVLIISASYNRISDSIQRDNHPGEVESRIDDEITRKEVIELDSESCQQKLVAIDPVSEPLGATTKHGVTVSARTWLSWIDRSVMMASLCYSMTGLIFIVTDELFPLFGAESQSVGGLGFSSSALGLILGEGGVVLCIYTLFWYPQVARRLGPLQCFRVGILSTIPLWIGFPVSSLLDGSPLLQWGLLLTCMAVRSISACTTFTGVLILVSNSASADNMGAVTGLSHSFCSLFRAVGPAAGGLVWSYASGKRFFLHQFLAWGFVLLLSTFTYALSFYLPPTLTQPKHSALRVDESIIDPRSKRCVTQ